MTSKNNLRGYSHEYLIAKKLIENAKESKLNNTETQKNIINHRKNLYEELSKNFPTEAEDIEFIATKTVSQLPEAKGTVSFVEKSANGSDVYDVIYFDINNKTIKVSCKLSKMEDKAYRFNTKNYTFEKEMRILKNFFTAEDAIMQRTYLESLESKNSSVRDLQIELINSLKESLQTQNNQSYIMMKKLISEKFIGNGGYYKTLPNGDLLYYPLQDFSKDSINIESLSIETSETTISFKVDLLDDFNQIKQKYKISFRIKFKDGVKKIVKLNSFGYPSNIAATVKLEMI